jgi:hypothetical protein
MIGQHQRRTQPFRLRVWRAIARLAARYIVTADDRTAAAYCVIHAVHDGIDTAMGHGTFRRLMEIRR